jgi:hypothetical protein
MQKDTKTKIHHSEPMTYSQIWADLKSIKLFFTMQMQEDRKKRIIQKQ